MSVLRIRVGGDLESTLTWADDFRKVVSFWEANPEIQPGVRVAVEVLNTDLEPVHAAAIPITEAREIAVDPGTYFIRVNLPSGRTTSVKIKVGADETRDVAIPLRLRSPREWLAWQAFLGDVEAAPTPSPRGAPEPLEPMVLRVWTFSPQSRSWELTFQPGPQHSGDIYAKYTLQGRTDCLQLLEVSKVGGAGRAPEEPSRFQLLPPTPGLVEVTFRAAPRDQKKSRGVEVLVASQNGQAESLLRYLTSGAVEAARVVGAELVAERYLAGKLQDPMAAAIGGYFLLQVGAYERLHEWPNNFANWISWLPDAAVIHAWQFLRSEDDSPEQLSKARTRLLQAERNGVPVYAYGLRLLLDGLRLFQMDARAERRGDDEVDRALDQLGRYAAGVDWSQPVTSFRTGDLRTLTRPPTGGAHSTTKAHSATTAASSTEYLATGITADVADQTRIRIY